MFEKSIFSVVATLAFIFIQFFFILGSNNDIHNISDEFEFQPDPTSDCGISCPLKPLSDQKAFARRLRGVLKFSLFFQNATRTPRKNDFICEKKQAMASSQCPHRVLVASKVFLRSSHCFLWSSMWRSWSLHDVFTAFARRSWRSHRASTAFAPRFDGVRTALPRHSSTALTPCRQNKVSLICTFAFKKTA